jgi:thiol oxidase
MTAIRGLALRQLRRCSTAAGGVSFGTEFSPAFALTKNGERVPCTMNAKEVVLALPRGAYTTARTVNVTSVFEFDTHVTRLAQSSALMRAADVTGGSPPSPSLDVSALRQQLLDSIALGISDYRARNSGTGEVESPSSVGGAEELKITLLLTEGEGEEHNIYCHVCQLPGVPTPPIKVEVRGEPRANALAKDSEWIRQRQALEDQKVLRG